MIVWTDYKLMHCRLIGDLDICRVCGCCVEAPTYIFDGLYAK